MNSSSFQLFFVALAALCAFTLQPVRSGVRETIAELFVPVAWPPLVEFAVISFATLLLSYATHRLIRRSALALFLFNGLPMSRKALDDGRPQSGITTLR